MDLALSSNFFHSHEHYKRFLSQLAKKKTQEILRREVMEIMPVPVAVTARYQTWVEVTVARHLPSVTPPMDRYCCQTKSQTKAPQSCDYRVRRYNGSTLSVYLTPYVFTQTDQSSPQSAVVLLVIHGDSTAIGVFLFKYYL